MNQTTLACPRCGKPVHDTQHALNEMARMEAENERLRAALQFFLNSTTPSATMADVYRAQDRARAALDRDKAS